MGNKNRHSKIGGKVVSVVRKIASMCPQHQSACETYLTKTMTGLAAFGSFGHSA